MLEECGIRRAHLVGCGLGGAVALETARRSTRVGTLTLFGAAPAGEEFDLDPLFAPPGDRNALRESLEVALSAEFRRDQPDAVEVIADWRAEGDGDRQGWTAQVAALSGFDATDWLVEITQPALVGAGTADRLVPPEASRALADGLPRGEYVAWEGAGHFPFIERSREVNDRLAGVLAEHGNAE